MVRTTLIISLLIGAPVVYAQDEDSQEPERPTPSPSWRSTVPEKPQAAPSSNVNAPERNTKFERPVFDMSDFGVNTDVKVEEASETAEDYDESDVIADDEIVSSRNENLAESEATSSTPEQTVEQPVTEAEEMTEPAVAETPIRDEVQVDSAPPSVEDQASEIAQPAQIAEESEPVDTGATVENTAVLTPAEQQEQVAEIPTDQAPSSELNTNQYEPAQTASATPESTQPVAPETTAPQTRTLQEIRENFEFVLLDNERPEYPREALRERTEGWVDVELEVAPNGTVVEARAIRARPRRLFERSAVSAASQWRFEPPAAAGIETNLKKTYRINFSLADES